MEHVISSSLSAFSNLKVGRQLSVILSVIGMAEKLLNGGDMGLLPKISQIRFFTSCNVFSPPPCPSLLNETVYIIRAQAHDRNIQSWVFLWFASIF